MKTPSNKCLAKRIADELMSNNLNEQAKRLQLRGPNEEDYGGYCRNAVVEIIERHLRESR